MYWFTIFFNKQERWWVQGRRRTYTGALQIKVRQPSAHHYLHMSFIAHRTRSRLMAPPVTPTRFPVSYSSGLTSSPGVQFHGDIADTDKLYRWGKGAYSAYKVARKYWPAISAGAVAAGSFLYNRLYGTSSSPRKSSFAALPKIGRRRRLLSRKSRRRVSRRRRSVRRRAIPRKRLSRRLRRRLRR